MDSEPQTLQTKEIKIGNVTVWIAELNYDDGQAHIEKGQELLKKGDATNEEWIDHTASVVVTSFNTMAEIDPQKKNGAPTADANSPHLWTLVKLRKKFGRGTLNEVYKQIMTLSGLRLADSDQTAGEAKAA